ncbi:MAG: hypothetical protein PVI86_04655 [Phycisphaerae bacterium]
MAREGLAVSPDEGLDLVQEFFASEWQGIKARYDSSYGGLKPYLCKAFLWFARRRIIRMRDRSARLTDLADLAERIASSEDETVCQADLAAARKAWNQLPPGQDQVLLAYLEAGPRSERRLAREFSTTRYRIRELLAEAFSRVAVSLGEQGKVTDEDWPIALALWRRGLSLRETAQSLGLSTHQVQAARRRILDTIKSGILGAARSANTQERATTMSELNSREIGALLRRALTTPGDQRSLATIKSHAAEVLSFLDSDDVELDGEQARLLSEHPEWLGEILDAVAGEEALPTHEQAELDALIRAKVDDDRSVGAAFKDALLKDLPPELVNWDRWFGGVETCDKELQEALLECPDVIAARPECEPLLKFGIRPLTVFYATQAVRIVVDRSLKKQEDPECNSVFLPLGEVSQNTPSPRVTAEDVIDEIVCMAECGKDMAERLLWWLLGLMYVGQRSFLFDGMEAVPGDEGVWLRRVKCEMTTFECWEVLATLQKTPPLLDMPPKSSGLPQWATEQLPVQLWAQSVFENLGR